MENGQSNDGLLAVIKRETEEARKNPITIEPMTWDEVVETMQEMYRNYVPIAPYDPLEHMSPNVRAAISEAIRKDISENWGHAYAYGTKGDNLVNEYDLMDLMDLWCNPKKYIATPHFAPVKNFWHEGNNKCS